jgi:exopolysaccharide biosynthesis polyprenyl glycosylphosphotransferase
VRARGLAVTPVLAVGTSASVQQLASAMRLDARGGRHVVAACLVEQDAADAGARRRLAEAGIAVAGELAHVTEQVERTGARAVAVMAGDLAGDDLRRLAWELESTGAELLVSSGLAEIGSSRVHVGTVAGTPVFRVDSPQYGGFRRVLKGALDRSAAAVGLLLLSPVLVVLALLVRCTSRGPAFFLQTRVGRGGRTFRMVKFRSMYVDAEQRLADLIELNENDGHRFKMRNDPRVTPVGRVLRRFSLDELPQLVNIVTGSMSLVGPRPPLPSEVALYDDRTRRRLLVKPGLTGLWQVSGRSDLSWHESVTLDLHYIENWSLSLDIAVLLKTAKVVIRATGAY